MRSNHLKRFGIFVFSMLWAFLAAEIFLRAFQPQPMLPRYIQAGTFGVRVNMPDQHYWHTTPEYRVEIRTNSMGMRSDQEYSIDKPEGVKRILVLGDSFGMGYGVDLQESFTEVLRRNVAGTIHQTVEIINLSVSGYGTAEQLLMLQNVGLQYKPDLVLLTWHASDEIDNLRSGLYKTVDEELVRANSNYLPGVKIREYLFSFAAYRWLSGNSHFYNWVREFAAGRIKELIATLNQKKPTKSATPKKRKRDSSLSIALLDSLKLEAESAGAKLLILDIPVRKTRTSFKSSIPEDIKSRYVIASPIEQFMQHPGELLYWEESHGHFTPLGCSLVGNVLTEKVVKLL